MSATCEGCKYWRPKVEVNGPAPTQGECRKSEPALMGGRTMTKASDSCHLHHPKNRMGEGKFTR